MSDEQPKLHHTSGDESAKALLDSSTTHEGEVN